MMQQPRIDTDDLYVDEPERTQALRLAKDILDAYAATEIAPSHGSWKIMHLIRPGHAVPCGCALNALAEVRGLVRRVDGSGIPIWKYRPDLTALAGLMRLDVAVLSAVMPGWDDGDVGRLSFVRRLSWPYQAARAARIAFERAGHTVIATG